jgi:hypothetical protein
MERFIDDFLSSREIPHESEPAYPIDPDLNPGGRLRADWLVHGVFIEAAGLMSRADYRRKMENKRTLANRHGLDLIVVQDEDLARLDEVFQRWLG